MLEAPGALPPDPRGIGAKKKPVGAQLPRALRLYPAAAGAYNAGHDDTPFRDHYSNYVPGALIQTSRRDKAYGIPRRPSSLTRYDHCKDAKDVRRDT